MVEYFWYHGSGKTHLSNILAKKIEKVKILEEKNIENDMYENFINLIV